MKISTIYFPNEDEYEKIKELAYKERKTVSEIARESLEEYYKKHGDGNPVYTLDHFKDPNFIACPAFYRPREAWLSYMSQATPEELENIKRQIIMLDKILGRYL